MALRREIENAHPQGAALRHVYSKIEATASVIDGAKNKGICCPDL